MNLHSVNFFALEASGTYVHTPKQQWAIIFRCLDYYHCILQGYTYICTYMYVCMLKLPQKSVWSCKIENVATKPFWIMISLYSSTKFCNSTVCRDCEKSPKLINVGPMYIYSGL